MDENIENNFYEKIKQISRLPQNNYFINQRNNGSYHQKTQISTGRWTQKQNAKYFSFLKRFREQFSGKQSRRHWKVFKSLSQFLKSRDPNQCRSHHHKMKKNFSSIEEILEYLKKKEPGIEKKSQKYLTKLSELEFDDFGKSSINVPSNKLCTNQLKAFEQKNYEPVIDIGMHEQLSCCQIKNMNDIANKKTNAGYEDKEVVNANKNAECVQDFSQVPEVSFPSYFGFPSTGLLNHRSFQNNNNNPKNGCLNSNKRGQHGNEIDKKNEIRADKVLKCHYFFTKWMTALQSLLQGDGSHLNA